MTSPLSPIPRADIVDPHTGMLKPPWQNWFTQLATFIGAAAAGGGGLVPASRQILSIAPIQGGGDLSADRTFQLQASGVTNAYLAQMAANTIKGNNTAGSANPVDLTISQVQAMLSIAAAANPTGTIGLAAVNGSATTYMRSDAAPVLSQAITPTWSGVHTFSQPILGPNGAAATPAYSVGAGVSGLFGSATQASLVAGQTELVRTTNNGTADNGVLVGGYLRGSSGASPAALVANTDDYAPTNIGAIFFLRISATGAINLTGISAAALLGRILCLINIGTVNTITLVHDATSTAANRFFGPNSANVLLRPNSWVFLFYDVTSSRWRIHGA